MSLLEAIFFSNIIIIILPIFSTTATGARITENKHKWSLNACTLQKKLLQKKKIIIVGTKF